jgi:peptidoglycan hydrolase-like protein with peptidoglycan-binding domain
LLSKRSLAGLLLAAVAAGTGCVSAAAAQTTNQSSSKSTHKGSSASAHHSTSHATSNTATKAPGTKSTNGATSRSSSKKKSKRVKGQAAPTANRISEIQGALAKNGALTGTPTGKWDDDTVDAMKRFQASNGLNPSGKLDAPTLQKLGLGSETAGLAAPTPPPNSANRLRNNSSSPPEPRE